MGKVLIMTTVHVTYISWQDTHNMNVKNVAFCHQPKALHSDYHDYTSNNTYLHLDLTAASTFPQLLWSKYRTPHMHINWDGKQSGYVENPDNWIFL